MSIFKYHHKKVSGPVVLFQDSFASYSNGSLPSPWSVLSGTFNINSHQVLLGADGSSHAVVDLGSIPGAGYTIVAGFANVLGGGTQDDFGITFRQQDDSDFCRFIYYDTRITTAAFYLQSRGGAGTVGSGNASPVTSTPTLKVTVSGNVVNAYVNGTLICGATMTDFSSVTKIGVELGVAAGARLTSFVVTKGIN